jgi:proline iminopeptidase
LDAASAPAGDALDACIDRYRVQSHYLAHDCWLSRPTLLERCGTAPRVPTLLIHARDDHVCRPEGAAALHAQLPGSRLQWLDRAGHDPAHPAMAAAFAAALDCYAAGGSFAPAVATSR